MAIARNGDGMKVSTYVLGLLLAIAPLQSFSHDTADGTELLLTQFALAEAKALAEVRGGCALDMLAWIVAEKPSLEERIEAARYLAETGQYPSYPVSASSWSEIEETITKCAEEFEAAEKKANAALAALRAVRAENARPEANNTDVNVTNTDGDTPLIEAVEAGSLDQVRLLLEAGADVNTRNSNGETPLHWADDADVMRLLLEAGADVNARDSYGDTPLQNAVFLADDADVVLVRLLLEAGADANARNNDGDTPLQWAEHADVERLLREAGAK